MCVSMAKADFKGTRICLNDTNVPGLGQVHVLMYQNTAVSFAGPNAMLLHIPTQDIGQENFVDTSRFPHILDDMVDAHTPRNRGALRSAPKSVGSVQVFDVGMYTVVLAKSASDIPAALNRVPEAKRPMLNPALFDFYENAYPDFAVALCCFNSRFMSQAEPIMLWYPANCTENYRLPGIDCHTGGVPTLGVPVDVDHWLFLASDNMRGGKQVRYRERGMIPMDVLRLLPEQVYGAELHGRMPNGDFGIQEPKMLEYWGITRLAPPVRIV
ncbi:MAG: hypothetical protein JWN50_653 [Parcubacteria group bacterium]|nr:hypothetical protein [Parcubacteria group bacterium]